MEQNQPTPGEFTDRHQRILDRAFAKVQELSVAAEMNLVEHELSLAESPSTWKSIKEVEDKIDAERDLEKFTGLCQKWVNLHNHMFSRRVSIRGGKTDVSKEG